MKVLFVLIMVFLRNTPSSGEFCSSADNKSLSTHTLIMLNHLVSGLISFRVQLSGYPGEVFKQNKIKSDEGRSMNGNINDENVFSVTFQEKKKTNY